MRCFGLIPAAGSGLRMGKDMPKQYLALAGKPLIAHVLDAFFSVSEIEHSFVVIAADDAHFDTVAPEFTSRTTPLRVGGATRQQSVLNGLAAMRDRVDEADWILVHDAARPGITAALIARLIAALRDDEVGGLFALPLVDTLKRADPDSKTPRCVATVERAGVWQAQTPQMFRYGVLRRALAKAIAEGAAVTDEASALEALGLQPRLVTGSARNFKVTTVDDLEFAEAIFNGADYPR